MVNEDGTVFLTGIIQAADMKNGNGRIYPRKILMREVENYQKIINETTARDMEYWLKEGHFWRGTMEPKIRAALYFLKYHGEEVIITSIGKIDKAIQKKAGTRILNN